MVPLNRMGSWRMMDSRDLRVCRGSLEMSMLSITILPKEKAGSVRRRKGVEGRGSVCV